jgi:hypothetical protein
MTGESQTTTDHDVIRAWTEERQGTPARVRDTEAGSDDAGVLRIRFDPNETSLEPIGWDDFFAKFEAEKLAFLYQDRTADGQTSRFFKLVSR